MNDYLIYLFQVNIGFSLFFLVFFFFLRGLTFHSLNRIILLSLIPFSFLIPLAKMSFPIDNVLETNTATRVGDVLNEPTLVTGEYVRFLPESDFALVDLLIVVYWLGVSLLFLRILIGVMRLIKLRRNSSPFFKDGMKLLLADTSEVFSCFKWVFIPRKEMDLNPSSVLAHEKAHIYHFHTIDLVIAEIFTAFCWLNPFVHLYKRSIRELHEYQADEFVLKGSIRKSDYLRALIGSLGSGEQSYLYSNFKNPILKNRIIMITKTKTRLFRLTNYLLLLPVVALLLLAFSHPPRHSDLSIEIKYLVDEKSDIPSLFPVKGGSFSDITAEFGHEIVHPVRREKVVHHGIDIKAPAGTAVIATDDGTILQAELKNDWGNLVVINHAEGYSTWYAHLQKYEVEIGQKIKKGEVIGYVGNTGQSKGPHLHYEVRKNGERLDPMDFIQK